MNADNTDAPTQLTHKQHKLAQLGIPLFSPRFGNRLSATLDNQAQYLRLSPAERAVSITAAQAGDSSSSVRSAPDGEEVISSETSLSPVSISVADDETAVAEKFSDVNSKASGSDQPVVQLAEAVDDPFHPHVVAAAEKWPDLCERIREEPLPGFTHQVVPILGDGAREADWMLIGDAPGMVEEQSGKAYSGQAGQLLDQLFRALHLNRAQSLYLTHVVKHRPPNDRDPLPEEIEAAWLYLLNEIYLVQPKMIVVVGRLAAQRLLKTEAAIGSLRGRIHKIQVHSESPVVPLLVSHSPSYLMKSPSQKANAWEDMLLACQYLRDCPNA